MPEAIWSFLRWKMPSIDVNYNILCCEPPRCVSRSARIFIKINQFFVIIAFCLCADLNLPPNAEAFLSTFRKGACLRNFIISNHFETIKGGEHLPQPKLFSVDSSFTAAQSCCPMGCCTTIMSRFKSKYNGLLAQMDDFHVTKCN